MPKINISGYALAGAILCALLLGGCSGEQEKKSERKTPLTVQEQRGHEAAQTLKQPMEEARKAAAQAGAKADQALKEVPGEVQKASQAGGKKLEGC